MNDDSSSARAPVPTLSNRKAKFLKVDYDRDEYEVSNYINKKAPKKRGKPNWYLLGIALRAAGIDPPMKTPMKWDHEKKTWKREMA
tara:strand:+ start:1142 stop:1399 length:258 start_codon:yes stop_codon:yes gene_type:complete